MSASSKPEPGWSRRSTRSSPDQLSKLAALLQQDLITRAEFENLKAKLIAKARPQDG